MTLTELKNQWQDTPESHQHIHELFTSLVNKDEQLNAHRTWVEQNVWGFGERSFWWLWKLICEELPEKCPAMLEIGVFRAATLSLWQILKPDAFTVGITPLDTSGGVWESDYAKDIVTIFKQFNIPEPPTIIPFSSHEKIAIYRAKRYTEYSVVYLDGDHSFEGTLADLNDYAPMVKQGGYLVIDDCNNDMNMPFGYFTGIQTVTDAKTEWLSSNGSDWEFICSVVHISVFKRK